MRPFEAISKGFTIAARNMGVFAFLFVFNIIWNIAPLPFLGSQPQPGTIANKPFVAVLGLLFILINIFVQGGVFGILKDAITSDSKAVLGNVSKYGKQFYVRFLGLGAVILGGVLVSILVIGMLFALSAVVKNIIFNIAAVSIGVILAIVALYYLFLLFMSPYVLVMDDTTVFKALGNSKRFVKKNLGKVLGLSALLVLIGLGMGFLSGIMGGFISLVLQGMAFQVVTGVITGGVNAYLTLVISGALMSYYIALKS